MPAATATANRPPQPRRRGWRYTAVPENADWKIAREGTTCRKLVPGPFKNHACGKPASVTLLSPADPQGREWHYCAEHAAAHSSGPHWAENGVVMRWEAVSASAERAGWCSQHRCPETDCLADKHPHPIRIRNDTWRDAEQTGNATALITAAAEAALGYVRCLRCTPGNAAPIPVRFGNLAGRPLGGWIDEAVRSATAQHPDHQPVRVGFESEEMAALRAEIASIVSGGGQHAATQEEAPAARTEPQGAAPARHSAKGATAVAESRDPVAAEEDQAATVGRLRDQIEQIAPGSARFRAAEPDAYYTSPPVVPVSEVPASRAKKGRPRTASCLHRVDSGAWCKQCKAVVK